MRRSVAALCLSAVLLCAFAAGTMTVREFLATADQPCVRHGLADPLVDALVARMREPGRG